MGGFCVKCLGESNEDTMGTKVAHRWSTSVKSKYREQEELLVKKFSFSPEKNRKNLSSLTSDELNEEEINGVVDEFLTQGNTSSYIPVEFAPVNIQIRSSRQKLPSSHPASNTADLNLPQQPEFKDEKRKTPKLDRTRSGEQISLCKTHLRSSYSDGHL